MPSPLEEVFRMDAVVEADRRIRLPDSVLDALGAQAGDTVVFRIGADRRIVIENPAQPNRESPRSDGLLKSAVVSALLGDEEGPSDRPRRDVVSTIAHLADMHLKTRK